MWNVSETNMYCSKNDGLQIAYNRLECQNKCEANVLCVGISYELSGPTVDVNWCYLCFSDAMSPAIGCTFYRKPRGKNKL